MFKTYGSMLNAIYGEKSKVPVNGMDEKAGTQGGDLARLRRSFLFGQ